MQSESILQGNMAPSRIMLWSVLWIVSVLLVCMTGIFFTSQALNVVVEASVLLSVALIFVMILLCKIPIWLKTLSAVIMVLPSFVLLFWLFLLVIQVSSIVCGHGDPLHCAIRTERLGNAKLIVYDDDLGNKIVSTTGTAELERPIGFGLKWVKSIGREGDQCFIELTRIDEHHIKCVCKYWGVDPPKVLSSEIVTDLDSKGDKGM